MFLRALEFVGWCYLICGLLVLAMATAIVPDCPPETACMIVLLWPLWFFIAFMFLAAGGMR